MSIQLVNFGTIYKSRAPVLCILPRPYAQYYPKNTRGEKSPFPIAQRPPALAELCSFCHHKKAPLCKGSCHEPQRVTEVLFSICYFQFS